MLYVVVNPLKSYSYCLRWLDKFNGFINLDLSRISCISVPAQSASPAAAADGDVAQFSR